MYSGSPLASADAHTLDLARKGLLEAFGRAGDAISSRDIGSWKTHRSDPSVVRIPTPHALKGALRSGPDTRSDPRTPGWGFPNRAVALACTSFWRRSGNGCQHREEFGGPLRLEFLRRGAVKVAAASPRWARSSSNHVDILRWLLIIVMPSIRSVVSRGTDSRFFYFRSAWTRSMAAATWGGGPRCPGIRDDDGEDYEPGVSTAVASGLSIRSL